MMLDDVCSNLRNMRRRWPLTMTCALAVVSGAPAAAGPLGVSANVGVASDYRFRGVSLSDREPALQGGLDVKHASGLFAGSWASTITPNDGDDMEVDVYAGFAHTAGTIEVSVGTYAYLYPGAPGLEYVEFQASGTRAFGQASIMLQTAYTPRQRNVPVQNIYVAATGELAFVDSPFKLRARTGWEDGFVANKLDWEAGIAWCRRALTISAGLTGSNKGDDADLGRAARTGLMASVQASF
jgi:uncharacterized protein (TIGR02001 family)